VRIPDWHDAKTLWSDCVRKNSRSAVGYYSLAGCAVMEKDWPAAEQYLVRTIELKPDFAEAHERLGAVYLMEGKKLEAREQLERALALEPQLTEAQHNLMLLEQHRVQ
jgi:tetratricopeptide (TPR) repeat protein